MYGTTNHTIVYHSTKLEHQSDQGGRGKKGAPGVLMFLSAGPPDLARYVEMRKPCHNCHRRPCKYRTHWSRMRKDKVSCSRDSKVVRSGQNDLGV